MNTYLTLEEMANLCRIKPEHGLMRDTIFLQSLKNYYHVVNLTQYNGIKPNYSEMIEMVKNNSKLQLFTEQELLTRVNIVSQRDLSKSYRFLLSASIYLKSKNIDYTTMSNVEIVFFLKNNLTSIPTCYCGNNCNFLQNRYGNYCSKKCAANNESTKQKRKQTSIKVYGTDNVSKNKDVKDKILDTTQKKYGTDSYAKTEEFKTNYKNQMIEKYGVDNVFKSKEFINKNKKLNLQITYDTLVKLCDKKQINVEFSFEDYNGMRKNDNGILKWNKYDFHCRKCDKSFKSPIYTTTELSEIHCPYCDKNEMQFELAKFVSNYVNIFVNDRSTISPLELDIFIPTKNIAIEFNGLYWHSYQKLQDKNYHLNKTNKCLKSGVKLIHIFEDEWLSKQKIVKARIKHIIGAANYSIGARQCEIKEIDSKIKSKFLQKYHIQGDDNSPIRLGAFHKNRLVGVMTFCKLRKALGNKATDKCYELCRFATMGSMFNFPGLAGKLLNYFKKHYSWSEITTFADKRWSNGELYIKLGFEHIYDTKPNYWYIDGIKRYHRFSFRKDVLKNKLETYNENLSECENMLANGYLSIYDCGNMKFLMKKDK